MRSHQEIGRMGGQASARRRLVRACRCGAPLAGTDHGLKPVLCSACDSLAKRLCAELAIDLGPETEDGLVLTRMVIEA